MITSLDQFKQTITNFFYNIELNQRKKLTFYPFQIDGLKDIPKSEIDFYYPTDRSISVELSKDPRDNVVYFVANVPLLTGPQKAIYGMGVGYRSVDCNYTMWFNLENFLSYKNIFYFLIKGVPFNT